MVDGGWRYSYCWTWRKGSSSFVEDIILYSLRATQSWVVLSVVVVVEEKSSSGFNGPVAFSLGFIER